MKKFLILACTLFFGNIASAYDIMYKNMINDEMYNPNGQVIYCNDSICAEFKNEKSDKLLQPIGDKSAFNFQEYKKSYNKITTLNLPKKGTITNSKGKNGYNDNKGNVKLEPIYDGIYASDKYAPNYLIVKKDNKYAIYKISSNKLTEFKYDIAYINTKTTLVAYDGNKKNTFNKKGNLMPVGIVLYAIPVIALSAPSVIIFAAAWPIFIACDFGDILFAPVNMLENLEKVLFKKPETILFTD